MLLVACGLTGWSGQSPCMDMTGLAVPEGTPPILSLRGEIVAGDRDRLVEALDVVGSRSGRPVLVLDSPGGNILEADDMANLIKRLGLGVVVADGEECASACFLLFAASRHRAAAPGARIGVHSASLFGDENLLTLDVTALMARDAAAFGVPPSVLGRMITTVPSEMAWLTDDELRQMNVLREGPPASGQGPAPRLATLLEPPARPDQPTAALPALREPSGSASGNPPSLSYRAGDARDPDLTPRPRLLQQPIELTGTVKQAGPVYLPNGLTASATPHYRPGV